MDDLPGQVKAWRDKGNTLVGSGQKRDGVHAYGEGIRAWRENGAQRLGKAAEEAAKTAGNRAACLVMLADEDASAGRAREAEQGWAEAAEDALLSLRLQPCYPRGMLLYGTAVKKLNDARATPLNTPVWPFLSACSLDERYTEEVLRLGVVPSTSKARRSHRQKTPAQQLWTVRRTEGEKAAVATSGRCLLAAGPVGPGQVLVPAAAAFALSADRPLDACKRCGSPVETVSHVCKACSSAAYCGRACKAADAGLHAGGECTALAKLPGARKKLDAASDAFGLSLEKAGTLSFLPGEEHGVPPVSSGVASAALVDADDVITVAGLCLSVVFRLAKEAEVNHTPSPAASGGTLWTSVLELEAHQEVLDVSSRCARAPVNVVALGVACEIVRKSAQLTEGVSRLCDRHVLLKGKPVEHCLSRCLCIALTNSFEVNDAIALVPPPLAWVNHGCRPNAVRNEAGDVLAVEPIEQGGEILISYIADLMQPRRRRRAALESLHGFTCSCTACTAEDDGGTATVYPLSSAVRCVVTPSCPGWVSVTESEGPWPCSVCWEPHVPSDVCEVVDQVEADIERVVPVLHGSIAALGDVDTELLAELESIARVAGRHFHPFHWLSHRVHAALIRPYVHLQQNAEAAAHSFLAFAAMEATLPTHWVGKSDRALFVAEHYTKMAADAVPSYLKVLYTQAVLRGVGDSLNNMGMQ
ncbi:hypothetical protein DIPPA_29118 [Diplonema papillatum]|nr:hypothetical protein DIPPA_29118 [Diplonema papillatum]